MRYGLIEGLQELNAYILGATKVPYIYYNPSGSWEDALPKFEKQRTDDNSETSACTVFASINQAETFIKFVYNYEPNYSERFIYNLVPIEPTRGADPQSTHQTIRDRGLIDEQDLPMTRTIEEYTDKSDITGTLLAKGQNWLLKHDYMHEWCWESGKRPENYIEVLRDALKTSPIAVSVSAWNEVNGVYVSNQGSVNNHYCLLYKIDDEGYPWVFDTYDNSKKKLAKDHNIRRAKRIWVNEKKIKSMRTHIALLTTILKTLKLMKLTLLDVVAMNLGKDPTPSDDRVPGGAKDELACVDSLTTLLRVVYPEVPKEVSTIRINKWFREAKGWVKVREPEAGAVIVSPTEGTRVGHCGVCMEDGTIASNNSFGRYKGLFTKNYTIGTWRKYYQDKQELEVNIYKKI